MERARLRHLFVVADRLACGGGATTPVLTLKDL
jgi:hypothetical protein